MVDVEKGIKGAFPLTVSEIKKDLKDCGYRAVLGRDVLQHTNFNYNGRSNTYNIEFKHEEL